MWFVCVYVCGGVIVFVWMVLLCERVCVFAFACLCVKVICRCK